MLVIVLVLWWSPEALLTSSLFHITLLSRLSFLIIFFLGQSCLFVLFIMLDNKPSNLITIDIRIEAIGPLLLVCSSSWIIVILWLLWYFYNHRISGRVPTDVVHLFCLQSELLSNVWWWKKPWLRVLRNCHTIKTVVRWWRRMVLWWLISLLWALTSLWSI